jgi:3-methyladenine DNA glycosylase AlkD
VNVPAVRKELVAALKAAGDAERAQGMQAYMKTTMPFWGVPHPVMRKLARELFKRHPVTTRAEWLGVAEDLWRQAEHREEWYAAIEWTGLPVANAWQRANLLPLYEEMIVTSAWWDTVDELAVHRVGPLLRYEPTVMRPTLLRWSKDENIWRRRTAILSQLDFKEDTDLKLLFATIEPSLERKEFWLRKAIGWALRHQARVHPKQMLAYVRANRQSLSGLSRREALKHYPESVRSELI